MNPLRNLMASMAALLVLSVMTPTAAAATYVVAKYDGHLDNTLDASFHPNASGSNYYYLYKTSNGGLVSHDLEICFFNAAGNQIGCKTGAGDPAGYTPSGTVAFKVFLAQGWDVGYTLKLLSKS